MNHTKAYRDNIAGTCSSFGQAMHKCAGIIPFSGHTDLASRHTQSVQFQGG